MIEYFQMADAFMFQLPRKFVFGNGTIQKLGDESSKMFEGRRLLLVTDKGVREAGLTDEALSRLTSGGFEVKVFDDVRPDAPLKVIQACIESIKDYSSQVILGLGGGSVLDTAKAAALLVTQSGDIRQYLGIDRVTKHGLPFVLIPTTAGTGSELSNAFVISDSESNAKYGCYSQYAFADLALVDPELTLRMPPWLTAESGIDAFSHALESYVCTRANPLSDLFALRAIELIAGHIEAAYSDGENNIGARYAMSLGSCFATMAIRSSGLGLVHAASNPMVMKYHISHGQAIGLMLPAVMQFNLGEAEEKYAAVAATMGEDVSGLSKSETAHTAVTAVKRLIRHLNLPQKLQDVGGSKEDISAFSQSILDRSPHLMAVNPRTATHKDLVEIYNSVY